MIMSKEDQETWRHLILRGSQPQGHCKCAVSVEIQEDKECKEIKFATKIEGIKMKTPQEKAAELLPFVQALANGEKVMQSVDGIEVESNGNFVYGLTYSIRPKVMLVNGFEVPESLREEPADGDFYFIPTVESNDFSDRMLWGSDEYDKRYLSRGLVHSTKEAAIAHAKAMLGIDPKGGE